MILFLAANYKFDELVDMIVGFWTAICSVFG